MFNNINDDEAKVLKSLVKQQYDCTGGEFGYMSDVNKCGLTNQQFAGYVSSLSKKGVFSYLDEHDEFDGQFSVNPEYLNL